MLKIFTAWIIRNDHTWDLSFIEGMFRNPENFANGSTTKIFATKIKA